LGFSGTEIKCGRVSSREAKKKETGEDLEENGEGEGKRSKSDGGFWRPTGKMGENLGSIRWPQEESLETIGE